MIMKITKFDHACLLVSIQNSNILIDPGSFTKLPETMLNINTIIITDEHQDHYNLKNINKIKSNNPKVQIYGTQKISNLLRLEDIECNEVINVTEFMVGDSKVILTKKPHAVVYGKSPCDVVTVLIEDLFYYPSDSFVITNKSIKVVALPASGPWYKVSEAIDFVNNITSEYVLVTHDYLNSNIGNNITNEAIKPRIINKDRVYLYLKSGELYQF